MNISPTPNRSFDNEVLQFWAAQALWQRTAADAIAAYLD